MTCDAEVWDHKCKEEAGHAGHHRCFCGGHWEQGGQPDE